MNAKRSLGFFSVSRIGIIVGCAICGAVVLAAVIVFLCCFWQRRKRYYGNQPRLFHNRKPASSYPVAQTTVTNPGEQHHTLRREYVKSQNYEVQ